MTNDFAARRLASMDDPVLAVLRAYPAIYIACHVEHRTRGRSAGGLTSRDAGLLAHVILGHERTLRTWVDFLRAEAQPNG